MSAALDLFHPVVAEWFRERFAEPTEPQERGWPAIAEGRDTLIAAPTGSGKTLAAFLACIDRLMKRGLAGKLRPGIDVLYVSPLKALSNDIHRNLSAPLEELRVLAAKQGLALPEIEAAVRTGDTPPYERQKMVRRPPHILITTPESLYILLTSKGGRAALETVRTVIVDEIHAVAADKRGAHLALTLERLDRLVTRSHRPAPVRVGLSATQKPIETVARLLVGTRRPLPLIIDGGHARVIDIAIEITDDELGAVTSHEQLARIYDRIAELVSQHQTTLVFVNTRKLVEKTAYALEERLGAEQVVAHHGSMSRRLRFAAEQKLKYGGVRCAVATASLELGIDVGSVDLVAQIGSPRSIATLLQRVGRSGHSLGATPKGRLYPTTRDQLVECAALVRAMKALELDAIEPRVAPLDILSQQIVAEAACGEELDEGELFEMVRGAASYAELDRSSFDEVLHMLSEGISDRRGRTRAHLHRDRINNKISPRRGARLSAITSGGAIPDNASYPVVLVPEETRVGELEEDFALESMAGDVFQLGNTSWRIRRVEAGKVLVEDAHNATPTIPFWLGEAPARTAELSAGVGALRGEIEARLVAGRSQREVTAWLGPLCSMSEDAAAQAVAYVAAGVRALGAAPTATTIVAERFFDETGGMQLVIHSPLGGRINRAWGLALRKRFCRSFDFELQAAATDDGLILSLAQAHSFPLETVFEFLRPHNVRALLVQALLAAPMFGVRWRWNVTRALAVLRRSGGKRIAPHLVRSRSDDLLSLVFPAQQACLENVVGDIEVPDHPLVTETMRDCLTEAMDIDGLEKLLRKIEAGEIRTVARDTVEPSPFSHEIINANPYAYLDDAGLEERRTRAVMLRRGLGGADEDHLAALDAGAIDRAAEEARPTVRDHHELHDALLSLYVVPETSPEATEWQPHYTALVQGGRATTLRLEGHALWVAAERLPVVRTIYPDAVADPELPPLPFEVAVPDPEVALVTMVAARLDHAGPHTAAELARWFGIGVDRIDAALLALESDGAILRGSFRAGVADLEWCNRRVLARIHRLTLTRLRSEIQPVTAAALMRFLFRWQRVSRGNRLLGVDGLTRVIEQLQGFESAAGAWEREILPARLHEYDPTWLDQLCLSGEVAWCRLSARRFGAADTMARVTPTKAAPLALMLREDLGWLRAPGGAGGAHGDGDGDGSLELSDAARAVRDFLVARGASFLSELTGGTGLEAGQVEEGLWELVALGLATADGFASLRVLVDRHRGTSRSHFDPPGPSSPSSSGKWQRVLRKARRRDNRRPATAMRSLPTAAGRWSLLGPPDGSLLDPDATARQLLCRYGVVFRDLLVRESSLPPWRELAGALRRMEARGEIRGGRFVSGFVGEQFALHEAVEGLRAMRRPPQIAELVRVPATDPLNLVGVTSGGSKVPAIIGNAVLYRDGAPLASLESGELIMRGQLEPGERVDPDLRFVAAPRTSQPTPRTLPLF